MTKRTEAAEVLHVIRIRSWTFDYSFGVDNSPKSDSLYYEARELLIEGEIERPTGLKAKLGKINFRPDPHLIGASEKSKKQRLVHIGDPRPVRPVGYVYYRGSEYVAKLFYPADMLLPILQMLTAEKYRFVSFTAEKGGRDASIFGFSLLARFSELEAAGWDDA